MDLTKRIKHYVNKWGAWWGDVLAISETEISICENVENLYERLKIIGAELIIKVLNNFDYFYENKKKQWK